MGYYIGIDLGTSAVKLLLMRGDGKIETTVSYSYELSFPNPGWSEQRPEDWLAAVKEGLLALGSYCDKNGLSREEIAGISCGGQMHGLVILDEQDRVIRPAILWNDGRSQEECDYLNEEIGRKQLSEWTANIAFAGFTAPKLLWVKKHEPENFSRIKKVMLPKDYITYMLSGSFATDVSDASGMLLFDVKNRSWSREMVALCDLRPEQLPRVYESYEKVGVLLPGLAGELGFSREVVLAAGAGDNAAAAIGTATTGDGSCNLSLGTSGTLFVSAKSFGVDPFNALHSFCHADGSYHLMGCMLSAASCNKWWMEDILNTRDFGKEQESIVSLGDNPVYFLPYLMGERSPHNDPRARGTFIGMTMDTTREEMTQAVMEGVAYALRDSLEVVRELGISIKRSKICGGGAKSPLWRKIMANILNLGLDILEHEEGPGLGAAILAAVACGEYASVAEAAERIVKVVKSIEPDPEIARKYEIRYAFFKSLYPTLAPVFAGHSDTQQIIKAYEMAREAHEGQMRSGLPYIGHPAAVADRVEGSKAKIVAYLHDTLEDTALEREAIKEQFGSEIYEAVLLLTRGQEPYEEYIERLKANPLARTVKLADLAENSRVEDEASLSEEGKKRLEKYRNALALLQQVK